CHLAHQSYGSGFLSVDGAAGQEQVANHCITEIALQPRDSAESRHEAEAQLGEAEAGHLVGHDEVAGERQLKTAAEGNAMHRSDRDQRRSINRVQHTMNAFQKIAYTVQPLRRVQLLAAQVKLAQVGARAEPFLQSTVENQNACFGTE